MPFVLTAKEARSIEYASWDYDWTQNPNDWMQEQQDRLKRNIIIKDKLQRGITVAFRSGGHSLWPRVHSNDLCTYVPVASADDVHEGDIVFCQARPKMQFFGHIVHEKDFSNKAILFTIGNNKGYMNGHCLIEDIYGRLTDSVH